MEAPDADSRIRSDVISSMESPSVYSSLQIGEVSDKLHRFLRVGLSKMLAARHESVTHMRAALSETQLASLHLHFDVFLSYRVDGGDAPMVHQMYRELSESCPNDLPMFVFLDKMCLVDGEQWDHGFMSALSRSTCFAPLLSEGTLRRMFNMTSDVVDNVLLEWATSIELASRGVVLKIIPLFVDSFWAALKAHEQELSLAPLTRLEEVLQEHLESITGNNSIDGLRAAISKVATQLQKDAGQSQLTPLSVINVLCSYQGQVGDKPTTIDIAQTEVATTGGTQLPPVTRLSSSVQVGRLRVLSDQTRHVTKVVSTLSSFVETIKRAVMSIDPSLRATTANAGLREMGEGEAESENEGVRRQKRTVTTESQLAKALVQILELRAAHAQLKRENAVNRAAQGFMRSVKVSTLSDDEHSLVQQSTNASGSDGTVHCALPTAKSSDDGSYKSSSFQTTDEDVEGGRLRKTQSEEPGGGRQKLAP